MVWDRNTIAVIAAIIICGIVSAVLLSGNGAFMIAGYNTLSSEKKAKINTPKLCRFMGKFMLSIMAALIISLLYMITGMFFMLVFASAIFLAGLIAIIWGSIHYIVLPLRK